jgi:paraquat-inducible protein A
MVEDKFQKTDSSGLIICNSCDLLLKQINIEPGYTLFCPRCKCKLHTPKKNSVNRTLALSITAILIYIPAFFMPLMDFNYMGSEKSISIFDAIILFYNKEYFFVSLIILLTSLLFPFAKISLTFAISLCIKLKYYPGYLPEFMRYHTLIDDWGMLDIYMISILVALVKMHPLGYIRYNTGFFFFIFLLFTAICSSITIDKHLFWNRIEKKRYKKI